MVSPSVMFWFAAMVSAAKDFVKEEEKHKQKRRVRPRRRLFISVSSRISFSLRLTGNGIKCAMETWSVAKSSSMILYYVTYCFIMVFKCFIYLFLFG
jgi:hypothetical protein